MVHYTIEEASKIANVSTATIRNWIKTGYLAPSAKGRVIKDSFNHFMNTVAGTEKLNSRANKSYKNHQKTENNQSSVFNIINNYKGEQIGKAYESSLSDANRNKEGIYYTPSGIAGDMLSGIQIHADSTFLDPCCGSGNFIIEAIRKGASPQNVYGFDTDPNAVSITKERIKQEFGFESQNIKVCDFLYEASNLKEANESFDFIFTNPPWGKKLSKDEKERWASLHGSGKSADTTAIFMFASLNLLKKGGVLGFLIQEAFFNITAFETARSKILERNVLQIKDYGKAFKGLVTSTQAIIIKNEPKSQNAQITCIYEGNSFLRESKSFEKNPKKIMNFWADNEDAEIIKKLYSVPHITLAGNARWALGIVTGNNAKFCRSQPSKGYVPVFKGADITSTGLKKASAYIPENFSTFQQVAPIELYRAKEKLIYKFISSDLAFFYDSKQRYILNSANMLIPDEMEISIQQISDLLNSEVINWLFKKLFKTHKVLRSDLEALPLHTGYFKDNKVFSEDSYLKYLGIIKHESKYYC